MADYCAICGCDSFECGGGVTGVCIRADGGPYCARVEADGSACGEPAKSCSQLRAELAEAKAELEQERKRAALYDQECGMCGSTADELVEYAEWLNAREERRAANDAAEKSRRETGDW